jgi:hypothetical protein
MALRPTELQIILAATRDIEKVQSLYQQHPRSQQDQIALQFQHEIEHLKGKLIVDYASFFERLKIKRKLAQLVKRLKDEELPQSKTKSCQLQL